MPGRVIREGWLESERVDRLTPQAEVFLLRLLLRADDFGRYYAHTKLLKNSLFPLRDNIRDSDVSLWLTECESAGLVAVYEVDSKRYIEVRKFQQKPRAKKSKFPAPTGDPPPIASTCEQMHADENKCSQMLPYSESESYSESLSDASAREASIPTFEDVKTQADMLGVPESEAKSFFEYHEGNAYWLNKHGSLINWRHKLKSWEANGRKFNGSSKNNGKRDGRSPNRNGSHNDGIASQYAGL